MRYLLLETGDVLATEAGDQLTLETVEVFQYLELWTRPQAQGGTRLGFLGPPIAGKRRRRLTNDDAYSFGLLKTHRHAALIEKGKCIREILSVDGTSWREWPIEHYTKESGDNPLLVIDCIPMFHLLVKYPIVAVDADGYVYRDTGALLLTPSQITGTYIRSTTPSWIGTGTHTPAGVIDLPFAGDSALSGLRRMEEVTTYESQLRAVGTTSYEIDHIRIGASAAPLYLRTAKNLRSLTLETIPGQVTRVTTISGAPGDEGPSGIAWAYWDLTTVATDNLTLAAIHGGPGPIGFTNQNLPANPNLLVMDWEAWARSGAGAPAVVRHYVVSGIYALDRLQDTDNAVATFYSKAVVFTADAVKAVSWIVKKDSATRTDVVIRDTTASVNRLEAQITWSGAVPVLTMIAGTHLGSDDLGNGLYRIRFQSTSVTAANAHEARVYAAGQIVGATGGIAAYYCMAENSATPSALPEHLWLERADGTCSEVLSSNATTQVVGVGSGTGFTVGDWPRFVATRAGKHLTWLNAPVEEALYDLQPGEYEDGWDDTVQIHKNGLAGTWGNPSAKPDNWTGASAAVQTTDPKEVVTAGKSLSINQSISDGGVVAAPPPRVWRVRARKTTYCALAIIRLRAAISVGDITLRVKANGTVIGKGLVYQSPVNEFKLLYIEGLDLAAYVGTLPTLVTEIVKSNGTGTVNMIVDCINLFPSVSRRAPLEGCGGARIQQGINRFLQARAPLQYRMKADAVDLAKMGVAGQPDVVLGQTAYVADEGFGALTLRVAEIADIPGQPGQEHYEISSLPPQYSRDKAKPATLSIPFFEPIHVRAADRDTRNAALFIKAAVTASDATSVTVLLTVLDTLGGTPAVTYAAFGAVYVSGSGVGPYVFTKPAAGTGAGRVVFTATLQGRTDVVDAIDVPEQISAQPQLVAKAAPQSDTPAQRIVRIAAADGTGGATATVNYTAGGLTVTPATGATFTTIANINTVPSAGQYVEVTIDRPTFGAGAGRVQFQITATGMDPATVSVDVPAQERDTIALSARLKLQTINPTTVVVRVAVVDPFPPGGASVTLTYTLDTAGGATPASGGTLTPTADFATTGTIDYTVDRPNASAPARRFTVTATAASSGRIPTSTDIDVSPQDPPSLDLTSAEHASNTQWTITWAATGTVEVSKNGGAYGTPAAAGLTSGTAFARPIYGALADVYAFRVTNGGMQIADTVLVPAVSVLTGHSLSVGTLFGVDASPGPTSLQISWSSGGMPSGTTFDVEWQLIDSTGLLTGAAGYSVDVTSTLTVTPSPAFVEGSSARVTVIAKHQGKVILTKTKQALCTF